MKKESYFDTISSDWRCIHQGFGITITRPWFDLQNKLDRQLKLAGRVGLPVNKQDSVSTIGYKTDVKPGIVSFRSMQYFSPRAFQSNFLLIIYLPSILGRTIERQHCFSQKLNAEFLKSSFVFVQFLTSKRTSKLKVR